MSNDREYSAANIVAPYKNTAAMIAMWSIAVSSVSANTDLSTIFGKLAEGEFLTLANDSTATVYIALGDTSGTIAVSADGSGTSQSFPVFANTYRDFVVQESRTFLHYIMASGTGRITLYRSSTMRNQKPSFCFPAP